MNPDAGEASVELAPAEAEAPKSLVGRVVMGRLEDALQAADVREGGADGERRLARADVLRGAGDELATERLTVIETRTPVGSSPRSGK